MTASPPAPNAARRAWNTAEVAALARIQRRVPYWPPARIEKRQSRNVRSTMRHAHATTPFYRETMLERGLRPDDFRTAADLARLPLIDSLQVRAEPERFVAAPFAQRGREVFYTSGSSSGLRKRLLWDHRSLLLNVAHFERDRVVLERLAGESWSGEVLRGFLGTDRAGALARRVGMDVSAHQRLSIFPADFSSRTMRAIWSEHTLIARKASHYHHLAPDLPFEAAAERMNAIRPRVVFSFGSYADQFFRFLADSGAGVATPRCGSTSATWSRPRDASSPSAGSDACSTRPTERWRPARSAFSASAARASTSTPTCAPCAWSTARDGRWPPASPATW